MKNFTELSHSAFLSYINPSQVQVSSPFLSQNDEFFNLLTPYSSIMGSNGAVSNEMEISLTENSNSDSLNNSSVKKGRPWTPQEDRLLIESVKQHDGRNWKAIASKIPGRSFSQCTQRWKRMQPHKSRQPWSKFEDRSVLELVDKYGSNWTLISTYLQGRTSKQIRERYYNKLDQNINRNKFTEEDDLKILNKWKEIGPKWLQISKEFKGRPENMIKNRFYSYIKRKYQLNRNIPNYKSDLMSIEKPQENSNYLDSNEVNPSELDKIFEEEPENLENNFNKVYDLNEIYNVTNDKYEEEAEIKKIKNHFEYLKKKKNFLESTLLNLNERILLYERFGRASEQ